MDSNPKDKFCASNPLCGQCPGNCKTCIYAEAGLTCLKCNQWFSLDSNGSCTEDLCRVRDSAGACTQCKAGFFWNATATPPACQSNYSIANIEAQVGQGCLKIALKPDNTTYKCEVCRSSQFLRTVLVGDKCVSVYHDLGCTDNTCAACATDFTLKSSLTN